MDKTVPMEISELEMQDIDNEVDWKLAELKFKLINNLQLLKTLLLGCGNIGSQYDFENKFIQTHAKAIFFSNWIFI